MTLIKFNVNPIQDDTNQTGKLYSINWLSFNYIFIFAVCNLQTKKYLFNM